MATIPVIETKNSEDVKLFQELKLKELLTYLNNHSTYYKNLFKANSININSINTLEDLKQIPVTTKDDLYKFNKDFICVGPNKIIDYVTTSGTLGDPLTFVVS